MTITQSQQPEALRLADVLEKMPGYDWNKTYCEAAFQLRHIQRQNECLHAEIERHMNEAKQERTARIEAQQRLADMQELAAKAGLAHMKAVADAVAEEVAAELEACEERVVTLYEELETVYLVDIVRAIYGVHDAVADASTPSSAPRGGKFIPTVINMKLFKEGDKSKAICSFCKDVVSTTFKHRDVPFSDGIGVAKNILVSVCDCCGQVVATPPQSTPAIRLSRAKA